MANMDEISSIFEQSDIRANFDLRESQKSLNHNCKFYLLNITNVDG